tara:strand:+ start:6524 stop:7429 length:906 start_codon:yes stop_codon:yes gene_type:complete
VAAAVPAVRQQAVVRVDELFGNLEGVLGDQVRNTNRRALSFASGWLRDEQRKAWSRVRVRRASRDTWTYSREGAESDTRKLVGTFHSEHQWERRARLKQSELANKKLRLRRLRRKRNYSIREEAAVSTRAKTTQVKYGNAKKARDAWVRDVAWGRGFATTGAKGTGPRLHARGTRSQGRTLTAALATWNKPTDGSNSGWIDSGVTFVNYFDGMERMAHLLEAGHNIFHPSMKRIGYYAGERPVQKTFERGAPTMTRLWTGYMLHAIKMVQQGNGSWFKNEQWTGKEGKRRLRRLTVTLGKA